MASAEVEGLKAEIERLRAVLKPFADYYDMLERNSCLVGFDLIARKHGAILGHSDIQARDLKAAKDALVAGQGALK